jgi:hypothetical protein
MNTPYENLAKAIVLCAVQDYRKTLRILSRFPSRREALKEKNSILEFFRSGWFHALTSIDPEFLIRKLDGEVAA